MSKNNRSIIENFPVFKAINIIWMIFISDSKKSVCFLRKNERNCYVLLYGVLKACLNFNQNFS
jgi:hypothetical protein